MNVVGIQIDSVWEDKKANFEKARALIEGARVEPGSLIVLPEMFATGFSMNVEEMHEGDSAPTEAFLADQARAHEAFVLGGVINRDPTGRGRNEAVVFDPAGRECARYCKLHPFSFGEESKHYVAGQSLVLFAWHDFTVAVFICYDLRFPEVFRHAVERGADLFAVIACWPSVRKAHWMALLQARAIENQACVVGVNRCGNEPKISYEGRSMIVDPRGNVLADGGESEGTIAAALDHAALVEYRREFPALADMRVEYRKET